MPRTEATMGQFRHAVGQLFQLQFAANANRHHTSSPITSEPQMLVPSVLVCFARKATGDVRPGFGPCGVVALRLGRILRAFALRCRSLR